MMSQLLNNRYQIKALLGKGAMGQVYLAADWQTKQDVALKVIARELALDQEILTRFQREGEALRQLRHRNIVAFVEMFELRGHQIIAMEYVGGGNLHSLIQQAEVPLPRVREIALDLCDALISAHRLNIIHRDIKPQNILLTEEGVPKLADFGVARLMEASTQLTSTSTMVGTPHYMSPEAWEGWPLDAQADVWSLGIVLFEMLAGRVPFPDETTAAVMKKVLTAPLPDLRTLRPDAPEALVKIVERALTRDKAQRYASVRMMSVDIDQCLLPAAPKALPLAAVEPPILSQEEPLPAILAAPPVAEPKPEPPQPPPAAGNETTKPAAPAKQPSARSRRTLIWGGIGVLALLCLVAAGGLSWWAALGKFLAPAPSPTAFLFVPATATAHLPTQPGPTPAATNRLPTDTSAPQALAPSPTLAPSAKAATLAPSLTPAPPAGSSTSAPPTPAPSLTPPPTKAAPGIGSTLVSDKDGMTLLYVPAGGFLMGATEADVAQAAQECPVDCLKDEKPKHTVNLDAYWIDQTDVTNAMFAKFVQATHYKTEAEKAGAGVAFNAATKQLANTPGADWQHPQGPATDIGSLADHPVVQVSWNDAEAYCEWAGRRLPTEAEWEKAARGTDGRKYPWGNDPVAGNRLNFADKNLDVSWAITAIDDGYQFTSPVGHYAAGIGPYGALDMAGNVWQWVADWYGDNYYASSPDQNPAGPAAGDKRVMRGGSWRNVSRLARAADRNALAPATWTSDMGFRCAQ